MKPVKICEKNRDAIIKIIDEVNGWAVEHTVTVGMIFDAVDFAESRRLKMGLTKKQIVGAKLEISAIPKLPNSYKYQVVTGSAEIQIRPTGCFLVHVHKFKDWPARSQHNLFALALTSDQKEIAKEHLFFHACLG